MSNLSKLKVELKRIESRIADIQSLINSGGQKESAVQDWETQINGLKESKRYLEDAIRELE